MHLGPRLGGGAGRLIGLECLDEIGQVVERRHSLAPHRGVGRLAGNAEREGDRSAVSDDHLHVRRLRDDAGIAGIAGPDRRQRPTATILLGRHRQHDHLAGEVIADNEPERLDRRHQTTLHVAGAAAVHGAITDFRLKGRRGPGLRISRRNDVNVAAQDQRRARTLANEAAGNDRQLGPVDFGAGKVGIGLDIAERNHEALDLQPDAGQNLAHEVLHREFVAGDRRYRDQGG